MIDLVDVTDLNCGNCGEPALEADCPKHGAQENAQLRRGLLICTEFDLERGRECQCRLYVKCLECCAPDEIEGLD